MIVSVRALRRFIIGYIMLSKEILISNQHILNSFSAGIYRWLVKHSVCHDMASFVLSNSASLMIL